MNTCFLLGNLSTDPELKVAANGNAILKFNMATNYKFKDANGDTQEKADFHRCTMFGKRAEALAKHLAKGNKVLVRGRISYSSYEKEGEKRYSTDIILDDLEFAGGPKAGSTKSDSEPVDSWDDNG